MDLVTEKKRKEARKKMELSLEVRRLLKEAKAWAWLLDSRARFGSNMLLALKFNHFKLAILTCDGPAKQLFERLGITFDTEAIKLTTHSPRMLAEFVSRLPEAREESETEGVSEIVSDQFYLFGEAKRMGSEIVEPIHFVLSLAERCRNIFGISYYFLVQALDNKGEIKPDFIEKELKESVAKAAALAVEELSLREARGHMAAVLEAVSARWSAQKEAHQKEVERLALLLQFKRAVEKPVQS